MGPVANGESGEMYPPVLQQKITEIELGGLECQSKMAAYCVEGNWRYLRV